MTSAARLPDRCYVIAEAGSNHDGSLATALAMIDVAAAAGADAVKFQLFTAEGLYPANVGRVETPIGVVDFFDLLRDMELPVAWLPELQEHARAAGVDFLCTPFDVEAVAHVDELDVRAIKIASPELTDHELLRSAASTGRSIILSTGMSTLGDIEESLAVLREAGAAEVSLLQCVTAYPTPVRDLNLGAIPVLASSFGARVGLSDHSTDPVLAPSISVALGGTIVEKHFTLSRHMGTGPDHPFAVEPDELRQLVEAVRRIEEVEPTDRLLEVEQLHGRHAVDHAIGPRAKSISPAELELAACDRRAIHSLRRIEVGERLDRTNIKVLRGERNLRPGLHPRHLTTVLGASVTRAVDAGDGIEWADLLS